MGHDISSTSKGRRTAFGEGDMSPGTMGHYGAERRPTTHNTDLAGFGGILWRYAPSIAGMTLAALTLALIYLATAVPIYTATTTLFIDPRPRKIISDETIQGGLGSDFALVESQVNIIGSDSVLRRVVDTLNLTSDPEFVHPPATGFVAQLKDVIRGRSLPADPPIQAMESLARSLKVKRAQKTYVVEIEVSSTSPIKAARLTNAIVDAYIADQKAAKTDEARRANDIIDSRLGELREQVRKAETRADEFKKANKILTSEGGIVTEQQLGKLNTELITARAVAAESKTRMEQAKAAIKAGASPDTMPEAMKSGLIQKLRDQYAQIARRQAALETQLGKRHPVLIEIRSQLDEIRNQISLELKRISNSARNEFEISSNREREITASLDKLKEEVSRTNTAQIKLRELEQEVNASRELLRQFLARAKETEEEQKISTSEARIISPAAVPTKPSRPLTWLVLALGGLGGLGFGIARALVKDYVDPSVRDLEGTARAAMTNPLAIIPSPDQSGLASLYDWLFGRKSGAVRTVSYSDLMAALADAKGSHALQYRQSILRLLRQLKGQDRGEKTTSVMFLSPTSEAGTSATALAVAYAGALAGERALLVDAASATAALSNVFAAEFKEGQVVVLDRKEDLQSIVTRDVRSGLSFLPIALADLRTMKDQQRRRLVTGLKLLAADYDLIVVDAGALLEDEASISLLPAVDQLVYVARAMMTSRHDLREMSQIIEADSDRVVGAVLTLARH